MFDKAVIQKLFDEKKYQEIKGLLKNHLDIEDKDIQFLLALIYNEEKDYSHAFIHFLHASKLGHNEAERDLGIYLYQGYGCEPNYKEGLNWIKKAIEDGNVRAYCTLAHIYMNGLGMDKKDEHQCFLLYQKAAELGDNHAKEHLIECYEKGIGTSINIEKANALKNQGQP